MVLASDIQMEPMRHSVREVMSQRRAAPFGVLPRVNAAVLTGNAMWGKSRRQTR